MMAIVWEEIERKRLLEMVFLLRLLNEILEEPSENLLSEEITQDGTSLPRILDLRREKELAETLAFLAACTDDPSKVIAVCVDEGQCGKSMTIRMAVNNGSLNTVKEAFEKMARILERAAARGQTSPKQDENDLLRAIVTLNQNRILCRLRSRHATLKCNFSKMKSQKPKVLPIIAAAVAKIDGLAIPSISPAVLEDLQNRMRILETFFARLETMTKSEVGTEMGLNLLTEIVAAAREVEHYDALNKLLRQTGLEAERVTSLTTPIIKLGRYSKAASFLITAARGLSIFSEIEISAVKLSPTTRLLPYEPEDFLPVLLNGMFDGTDLETAISGVKTRLTKKYSSVGGVENVLSNISSTKVVTHAEIQLLFYYELHPTLMAARVICSSKRACFLCNLFIKLHGKFTVPSSHGKLYEKWTLPESVNELRGSSAQRIGVVIDHFKNAIENELRHEIRAPRQRSYPHPLESAIFPSAVWSSPRDQSETTLPSTISLVENSVPTGIQSRFLLPVGRDSRQNMQASKSNIASNSGQVTRPTGVMQISTSKSREAIKGSISVVENSNSSMNEGTTEVSQPYLPLICGELLVRELTRTGELLKVATPRIHLSLSFDRWKESAITLTQERDTSELRNRCKVKVKWLQESEIPRERQGQHFVELDTFLEGSQVTFNQGIEKTGFYLTRGSDVVWIEHHPVRV